MMTHELEESEAEVMQPGSGSSIPGPQSFEIHIEELVLHGLPPGDRFQIAASLKQELERVFRDRGIEPSLIDGGAIAWVDGGSFEVRPADRAETIGRQIAQAFYRTWEGGHSHRCLR